MKNWRNTTPSNLTEVVDGILIVEEWKDVEGYEGRYQVSNFGRVKSFVVCKNGRIRKGVLAEGYPQVDLKGNGDGSYEFRKIHRMVGFAFLPNPLNLPEINHKFGDRGDCRAWMIEWSTASDNMKHAYRVLGKQSNLNKVGEQCYNSKFKDEDILNIRKLAYSGVSLRNIADTYNQNKVWTIKRIVARQRWKHI